MRKLFTDNEVSLLAKNPSVYAVSSVEIQYTNAFKLHFIQRYLEGDSPSEIFRAAGLDPELLGYKRIERATYRWKRAYEAGTLAAGGEADARQLPSRTLLLTRLRECDKEIQRLRRQVRRLSGQNDARPRRKHSAERTSNCVPR